MFTLNILTPYHTYPKHLTKSFNYLFMYLKLLDGRHSVTTLITPRSALGPHSLLRLRVKGKYSKCQLAGVLYNGVWTEDAITPIWLLCCFFFVFLFFFSLFFFLLFVFCNWIWTKNNKTINILSHNGNKNSKVKKKMTERECTVLIRQVILLKTVMPQRWSTTPHRPLLLSIFYLFAILVVLSPNASRTSPNMPVMLFSVNLPKNGFWMNSSNLWHGSKHSSNNSKRLATGPRKGHMFVFFCCCF